MALFRFANLGEYIEKALDSGRISEKGLYFVVIRGDARQFRLAHPHEAGYAFVSWNYANEYIRISRKHEIDLARLGALIVKRQERPF